MLHSLSNMKRCRRCSFLIIETSTPGLRSELSTSRNCERCVFHAQLLNICCCQATAKGVRVTKRLNSMAKKRNESFIKAGDLFTLVSTNQYSLDHYFRLVDIGFKKTKLREDQDWQRFILMTMSLKSFSWIQAIKNGFKKKRSLSIVSGNGCLTTLASKEISL